MSPKDKTQLEERLRRVPGTSSPDKNESAPLATHASRLATGIPRSGSPAPGATSRIGGIPRSASPALVAPSRTMRPNSPPQAYARSSSPAPAQVSKIAGPSQIQPPGSPTSLARPKSFLPSRLGPPRSRFNSTSAPSGPPPTIQSRSSMDDDVFAANGHHAGPTRHSIEEQHEPTENGTDEITVTI